MQYFTIAGLRASRIGFGCAAIGGHDYGPADDPQSVSAIAAALDLGITLFDVADIYGLGHSEEILAKGLGARRHEVVIATKGGIRWDATAKSTHRDISPVYLRTAIDRSLARLRVERIPLYQLHWPDGVTPLEVALEELERAKAAGKIGEYGVCNCDPIPLLQGSGARPSTAQMPFNLVDRSAGDAMADCVARGVHTLAYNVLCHGLLSGKYHRNSIFSRTDLRNRLPAMYGEGQDRIWRALQEVESVAQAIGLKAGQVAANWVYTHSSISCVLVGIRTAHQIEEIVTGTDFRLPPAMTSRLNSIYGG